MPKNIHLHIFIWFWVILSFLTIAFFLILRVSGFRLNLKAKTLEKTGLIILSSEPKGASVFLNGKLKGKTPLKLSYLKPGLYHLEVKKENYKNWEKSLRVQPPLVNKEKALLFLENPEIIKVEEKIEPKKREDLEASILEKIGKEKEIRSWDFSKDKEKLVYLKDDEIWFYNKKEKELRLVARFSQPVKKVLFYPTSEHILFLINSELKIIETSGTSETKLLDLPSQKFWPDEDGRYIFFEENKELKKARIR